MGVVTELEQFLAAPQMLAHEPNSHHPVADLKCLAKAKHLSAWSKASGKMHRTSTEGIGQSS